jgi:hypothetical protein
MWHLKTIRRQCAQEASIIEIAGIHPKMIKEAINLATT